MWIVLDIIIVAIVGFYIYSSARRGFVRTFIELIGFFLAIYLSFTVSGAMAEGIFDSFVAPSVSGAIEEAIDASATENSKDMAEDVWEKIPDAFTGAAETFGISKETVYDAIEQGVDAADTKSVADAITKTSVKPIAVPFIKTLVGLIIFAVLMVLVKFLARILGRAVNIPLVGTLNKVLGGALGSLKGIMIAYVIVVILTLIMGYTSEGFLIFTKENVEESALFRLLAENSPFGN